MIMIFPLLGLIGTILGWHLQSDVLVSGGQAALGPFSTSYFCTMMGVVASILIIAMRANAVVGIQEIRDALHEGRESAGFSTEGGRP